LPRVFPPLPLAILLQITRPVARPETRFVRLDYRSVNPGTESIIDKRIAAVKRKKIVSTHFQQVFQRRDFRYLAEGKSGYPVYKSALGGIVPTVIQSTRGMVEFNQPGGVRQTPPETQPLFSTKLALHFRVFTCITKAAMRRTSLRVMVASAACATALLAQSQNIAPTGYGPSAYGPANPTVAADQAQQPQFNDPPPPPPGMQAAPNQAPLPNYPNAPYGQAPAPAANIPATLTLPAGSSISIRVNQWLSSDRNVIGDTFNGSLSQPIVVNGVVVAGRGAPVTGEVTEVNKQHSDTQSHLGLTLTSVTLANGQQAALQSDSMERTGRSATGGQQAGTVVGTTAIGAGIGAVAGGGIGAAIGAVAGLATGGAIASATKNRPTEVYPETMLTFRLTSPMTVETADGSNAFHFATQADYGTQPRMAMRPPSAGYPGSAGYAAPYPPAPYPYYSPYYYGPSIGVYIGPGYRYRRFRR